MRACVVEITNHPRLRDIITRYRRRSLAAFTWQEEAEMLRQLIVELEAYLAEDDIVGRRGAEVTADSLKDDAASEDCFGQVKCIGR